MSPIDFNIHSQMWLQWLGISAAKRSRRRGTRELDLRDQSQANYSFRDFDVISDLWIRGITAYIQREHNDDTDHVSNLTISEAKLNLQSRSGEGVLHRRGEGSVGVQMSHRFSHILSEKAIRGYRCNENRLWSHNHGPEKRNTPTLHLSRRKYRIKSTF